MNEIADKAANVATGVSVTGWVAGWTIGEINQWLQAGAFLVSMIAGLCAAYYYLRKAHQK